MSHLGGHHPTAATPSPGSSHVAIGPILVAPGWVSVATEFPPASRCRTDLKTEDKFPSLVEALWERQTSPGVGTRRGHKGHWGDPKGQVGGQGKHGEMGKTRKERGGGTGEPQRTRRSSEGTEG